MSSVQQSAPSSTTGPAQAPVLWWVRRDMRLDDNPALLAALRAGGPVVPVFIWSPEDDGQFQQGRYSRWWTKHTVIRFQRQVESVGSRLIVRRASETTRGLLQIAEETGAKSVYFNTLYDPISLVRDHEVKRALAKHDITTHCFNADVLYEPWQILDSNKQPYTTFKAFWQGVLTMPQPPTLPLPAPAALPLVDAALFSADVNELDWFMTPEQEASSDLLKFKWKPGIEGALEKLDKFLSDCLPVYHSERAKVDRASTSQLSPWLHTGTLSVRYLFYRVCARQADMAARGMENAAVSSTGFLQQVGYREYSRYLTFHFPFIHERTLLAHLRACPWRLDQQHFKAWRQGQTGYPLIDAAMRELWSTGWTHNRMRVVCASFMVKNLLLPWQWGLKHFWDAQMDADLECDALGWQYVTGGMTDAKPFEYMIDLESESQRFDPDGEFVRRWLPVLSRLPTKYIHAPWKAPHQVLITADVELGYNYPNRIISVEESVENLKRAVEVLRSAVVNPTPSTSSQAHPYLPPTLPLSATQGGDAKGTSGSGGLRGTGTHFMLPAAPAPQQQPGSAAARAAGASADAATGSNEPLPPPAAAARPQAARLHVPRGGGAAGAPQIEEAAVSHFARPQRRSRFAHDVAGAAAVGTGAGAGVGLGLNGAAIAAGVVCGSGGDVSQGLDEPGVTNNKQHGDHEHDHDPDMPTGSYTESMSEDDEGCYSEEVVSNTVGLSLPQASGLSCMNDAHTTRPPPAHQSQPTPTTNRHRMNNYGNGCDNGENEARMMEVDDLKPDQQQQQGDDAHEDGGRMAADAGTTSPPRPPPPSPQRPADAVTDSHTPAVHGEHTGAYDGENGVACASPPQPFAPPSAYQSAADAAAQRARPADPYEFATAHAPALEAAQRELLQERGAAAAAVPSAGVDGPSVVAALPSGTHKRRRSVGVSVEPSTGACSEDMAWQEDAS